MPESRRLRDRGPGGDSGRAATGPGRSPASRSRDGPGLSVWHGSVRPSTWPRPPPAAGNRGTASPGESRTAIPGDRSGVAGIRLTTRCHHGAGIRPGERPRVTRECGNLSGRHEGWPA
eukprot:748777-Hanusia_phi.AAC.1